MTTEPETLQIKENHPISNFKEAVHGEQQQTVCRAYVIKVDDEDG